MEPKPTRHHILNLDVLLNIMSLSDACTTSRLMRASRELYPEGPKYLLRDGVDIDNASSIPSFVAFMRAEYPRRLHLLDLLYIYAGRLSAAGSRILVEFLVDCAPLLNIRRLGIDRAEEFFKSSRGLAGAFGLLGHIKHLTLFEVGPRTSVFLRNSPSSLVSADLGMIPPPLDDEQDAARDSVGEGEDEDDDEDLHLDSEDDEDTDDGDDEESDYVYADYGNPILLLHNSQETLTRLAVSACDTFAEADDHEYAQRYPHVHTLTLTANELPATLHYARAFPAVRTLTLRCAPHEVDALGPARADVQAFRLANQIDLTAAGMVWPALTAVHGALTDHFLLGLAGPVEQLHVAGCYMDRWMFRTVLLVTHPRYVYFSGFDVNLFAEGAFNKLMRGPLVAPVRCFDIMVAFGSVLQPEQVDVPAALDALIEGIGKMPSLRSFGLTLACFGLQPDGEMLRDVARPGKLCPAEEHLRDLDLDGLALRICGAVPGLQTVAISLFGHRARPNAMATLGEDVSYEEVAVERLPMLRAARVVALDLKKSLVMQ